MTDADDAWASDYERKIVEQVDTCGWFCTAVVSNKEEKPTFAYSIGFMRTLKCPEFIIFGLNYRLMHSMIGSIFDQIKAGNAPTDQRRWSDVLANHDCVSRAVHPTNIVRSYFNSAMWFLGQDTGSEAQLSAFQLFWPDVETKLYPWEEGCPQLVRDLQPLLYEPNLTKA